MDKAFDKESPSQHDHPQIKYSLAQNAAVQQLKHDTKVQPAN